MLDEYRETVTSVGGTTAGRRTVTGAASARVPGAVAARRSVKPRPARVCEREYAKERRPGSAVAGSVDNHNILIYGNTRPGARPVAVAIQDSKVHTLVNLKVYDALAALESDAPATKRYPTKAGMPSTSAQPTSAFGSNGSVSAGSPYFIR